MQSIGTHYIWDVANIEETTISYSKDVLLVLREIVAASGLEIVGENVKQFQPVGVTAVMLLAESHCSIHTWPEEGFAAIDLFSCKPTEVSAIEAILKKYWPTAHITFQQVERGVKAVRAHAR